MTPHRVTLSRRSALIGLIAAPLAANPSMAQGDPSAPIAALQTALLAAMKSGRATPFPQRYNALAPAIDGAFDIDTILRNSVGLRWDQLPADQQASLSQVFRSFTIASWTANFDNYQGQRFEILPERRSVGADQVVETNLVQPDKSTRLDFVMHAGAAGWRAVDVLLDGKISRVTTQRSDFRGLLNAAGAEPLIRSLQDKVATLSGGTVTA